MGLFGNPTFCDKLMVTWIKTEYIPESRALAKKKNNIYSPCYVTLKALYL